MSMFLHNKVIILLRMFILKKLYYIFPEQMSSPSIFGEVRVPRT